MTETQLTDKERIALLTLAGAAEVGTVIEREAIRALRAKGLIRARGPDHYDLTAAGQRLCDDLRK